jgi:hypothetical protein
VAALVSLVEVDEVGGRLLDPAARGPEALAGERGESDGERDVRRGLAGRKCFSLSLSELPVLPGWRSRGARQPIERDVVDDVVAAEVAHRLAVDERAGDLW